MGDDLGSWSPLRPEDARSWLVRFPTAWWIAGGWALDLFLGRETRPHADLDVGIWREDQLAAVAALAGFELHAARDGTLRRLRAGEIAGAEVHSLWCRRDAAGPWLLELFLDERDGDCWIYRRNPAVRRPLARLLARTSSGLPYLQPEVQLLYKAKAPRARDQQDFGLVEPLLDEPARAWLRDALHRSHPGHPWLPALAPREPHS